MGRRGLVGSWLDCMSLFLYEVTLAIPLGLLAGLAGALQFKD